MKKIYNLAQDTIIGCQDGSDNDAIRGRWTGLGKGLRCSQCTVTLCKHWSNANLFNGGLREINSDLLRSPRV